MAMRKFFNEIRGMKVKDVQRPLTTNLKLFECKLPDSFVHQSFYIQREGEGPLKIETEATVGVEALLFRVPETLSDDVLVQMRAPPKDVVVRVPAFEIW